jgi:hypothetical protein
MTMAIFIVTHRCVGMGSEPAFGGQDWHRSAAEIAADLVLRRARYMVDCRGSPAALVVRRDRWNGAQYLAVDGESDPPSILQSLPAAQC